MASGWKYMRAVAFTSILLAAGARSGMGQVVRPGSRAIAAPQPKYTASPGDLDDFMTLTLSGGPVNFAFASGSASNPGSSSVTVTLVWICPCDTPTFDLYAYFSSPVAALTDGAGNNIPSSAFSISDNGGAFRPLNSTQPFGGANAGLRLARIPFRGGLIGRHTDVLNFNINLSTGTLPSLPPGTYTGTLTIQAQAI